MLHPREYRFRVDPKTAEVLGKAKTIAELRHIFLHSNTPTKPPEKPTQE